MSRPEYLNLRLDSDTVAQARQICERLGLDPDSRGMLAQAVQFAVRHTTYAAECGREEPTMNVVYDDNGYVIDAQSTEAHRASGDALHQLATELLEAHGGTYRHDLIDWKAAFLAGGSDLPPLIEDDQSFYTDIEERPERLYWRSRDQVLWNLGVVMALFRQHGPVRIDMGRAEDLVDKLRRAIIGYHKGMVNSVSTRLEMR